MVETTTAEVLLAFVSLLGSSLADLPDRIDELVRVIAPVAYRESRMSVEEARLDRFWREYYDAIGRFNNDMSKLDWVAFHKNHGVQVNGADADLNGGSGRIQFAPMVVVPRMEWSVPPVAKLGSAAARPRAVVYPFGWQPGNVHPYVNGAPPGYPPTPNAPSGFAPSGTISAPDGPAPSSFEKKVPDVDVPGTTGGAAPNPTEKDRLERFWKDYREMLNLFYNDPKNVADWKDWTGKTNSRYYQIISGTKPAQFAPTIASGMVLQVKMVASEQVGGVRNPLSVACEPPSWVCPLGESGAFRAGDASNLILASGTAKDLLAAPQGNALVQANLSAAQAASVGTTLVGRITPISANRVRLDLTLEKSDVESAGKDNVLIASKTYRLVQQLQIGQPTKIVLQADAAGEAKTWLEVVVRQAPVQAGTAENRPGPVPAPPGFPQARPAPGSPGVGAYPPVPWGTPIPGVTQPKGRKNREP